MLWNSSLNFVSVFANTFFEEVGSDCISRIWRAKVFGDTTRARILCCLEVRELYVGELAEILGMSVSAVSHQLRVLRNAKLVRGVKEGKEVKYALDDNHVMMIIECGLSHLRERDENEEKGEKA